MTDEDLFKFILREIPVKECRAYYDEEENFIKFGMTKKPEGLRVDLYVDRIGVEIHEKLVIRKDWPDGVFEKIIYENRYEEKTRYIAREVMDTIRTFGSSVGKCSRG